MKTYINNKVLRVELAKNDLEGKSPSDRTQLAFHSGIGASTLGLMCSGHASVTKSNQSAIMAVLGDVRGLFYDAE